MSKRAAMPFDALLGLTRLRMPQSRSTTVVVAGEKIADVRQIERKLVDDERDDDIAIAEARKLRAEIDRARQAARYQADKLDPAKMAKRKAWMEANPEKVAEYRRRNRERNRDRNRKIAADFARRKYHTDPEAARAKARAWYQCNRDRILARLKQQREEARKSRKGGQS